MSGWKTNLRAPGRLICLLAAVLGLLGSAGCAKRESHGSSLRISQRNEPATLDPQKASLPDEFFIIRALSEGLVTPSPTGGPPLPAAATSWEVSPDGLTWTFHLRAGATWSSGEPVTAGDFVYTIRRALDPKTIAPKAALFFPLKGAAALYHGTGTALGAEPRDDQTLVLTLERPAADFLALVASGPWIPVSRAAVERDPARWAEAGHFVGNGRYALVEWAASQRITVKKNPRHWDAAGTTLDTIEFLAFDNGETEERAFRAGQIDVTLSVPATKLGTYRNMEPTILHTVPLYETRYLALNTTRAPLNDARVRRALSLALDRNALVTKVLQAGQQPAYTFVPRGLGDSKPTTTLKEDVMEARLLLTQAGFPGGRGFPKLELSTWPVSTAQLEAVQQMWREQLGIEVAIVQREARTHLAALSAGAYDIGFATAIPDYDSASDLLTRFITGHEGNYAQWSDADFDRLVAAGGALPAAESRLLEQMPVIPLYFNTKNFLLRPNIHGWQEDALWTRFYDRVTITPE
jgi:oligopeptide transport system substrate-binding protein